MEQHSKIKIYCINRKQDIERKKFMLEQLEKLPFPFEFVEAVDAIDLQKPYEKYGYDRSKRQKYFTNDLTTNEIACFLSHKKALSQFIESNYKFAIILEDDALILEGFEQKIKKITSLPTYLFDAIRLEQRSSKGYKVPNSDFIYPLKASGFAGVLYHKSSAKKILSHLDSFFEPIDIHIPKLFRQNIVFLQLCKPIVEELTSGFPSTIGKRVFKSRTFYGKSEKLKVSIQKRIFFFTSIYPNFLRLKS